MSQYHLQQKHKASPKELRIGKRYRANRLAEQYDAIVVGSGPSGLCSAACLAKMGKRVLVLEQHYTAGGFSHAYGRNGYEWDVGVHYIGNMARRTSSGRALFDFVSNGQLDWADMGEVYDRVFIGEQSFDFRQGQSQLISDLQQRYPAEADAIARFFNLVRRVNRGMTVLSMAKLMPPALAKLWLFVQRKKLPEQMQLTTAEVLDHYFQDPTLKAIIATQWGDGGLPPKQSSFIIHCLISRHFVNGGYFPIGGASQIARTIVPTIEAAGGDVFTYADVEQILTEGDQARGVRMADGTEILCDIVISATGVPITFEKLLPKAISDRLGYTQLRNEVEPSMANLSVFIGLNADAQQLALPKSNFWIYPSNDYDADVDAFTKDATHPVPLIFVSFPSAKDPSWDQRYPGKATIEIVAPAQHEWFARWADQPWGNRGEDYLVQKQYWLDRLLPVLLEKLPQIEPHLDYIELATPLSTQYFCAYSKGEIYGLNHTPERFRQGLLRPKTSIKGLYLTGQDTLTAGIVGAASSGLLTAISVLGWRKGRALMKALKQSATAYSAAD